MEIAANPTQFSAGGGGGGTPYVQYTVHTFSCPLLNFAAESSASCPHLGKAPYNFLSFSLFPNLVNTCYWVKEPVRCTGTVFIYDFSYAEQIYYFHENSSEDS